MSNPIVQQARVGSALILAAVMCAFGAPAANAAKPPGKGPKPANAISVIPTIENISIVNGQLVASGTATALVHGQVVESPFTAPVDISLAADQTGAGACPILDLELGPIHLDLLGLVVDTSPICLQITAYEGGGLLGDLLCAVAGLLDGGLTLDQILAGQGLVDPITGAEILPGLTATQIDDLLTGLENLLNNALGQLLDAIGELLQPGGRGTCSILYLELGPLQLNLLGLEVILDDCEGGPVVVAVTGEQGRGNLLGNVLCGLLDDGLLGIGSTLADVQDAVLAAVSQ